MVGWNLKFQFSSAKKDKKLLCYRKPCSRIYEVYDCIR